MSETQQAIDSPVITETITCNNGSSIGIITLNKEKTLNALTLDMVRLMYACLLLWKADKNIVCVFIKGAGQKAFCAGGDVQALYRSAIEKPGGPCDHAETFFTEEYQLNFLLHQFQKPVICWGDGIVMGGGLGIFAACNYRIVTEKTRMAMPEVSIGLYPDVGGSWFLNKMPTSTGMFLALTGASINAADAVYTGIADYFIESNSASLLLQALTDLQWSDQAEQNTQILNQLMSGLNEKGKAALPESNVHKHQTTIDELCANNDIKKMVAAISGLNSSDAWLARAQKTLQSGSALSVLIIHQQLIRSRQLALADVFRSEILLSTNIIRYPEFAEGVRALLIDKDNNPQWQFATIDDVPAQLLETFFVAPTFAAPWPSNPLAHL